MSGAAGIAPAGFSHQQVMRVIGGVLLCIFLAAIDQTVVIPAVPAMAADLHGFTHLSWIVSAYLLTSTAATPIYGRLSDMMGRRALLLPALVVFTATSVLCALATSLPQLILFRALQGLGGGGLMAMAQSAIADVVAPRERGRYQGYMAGVWAIASIAGPVLGGWVTDTASWRWIFWINVPFGLAAMVLCERGLRMLPVRRQTVRIDWLGAVLLIGAVTAWLFVLSSGGIELPWLSAPLLALGAAGLMLTLVLIRHERRTRDALFPARLFVNPVFLRGVGVAFCGSFGLFGATFLLPMFFQLVDGADPAGAGMLIAPFLGISCAGAFGAGQLARRLGRTKTILLGGLATCLVGCALMTLLEAEMPRYLAVLVTLPLGFGIGVIMPSSIVIVQNAAERRDVGVATGSLLLLRSMGGAFGTTAVGALLAAHATVALPGLRAGTLAGIDPAAMVGGFHAAFIACGLVLGIAIVLAIGMRDLPLRATNEPVAATH